jgi:signal transduction histidine kinase
MQQMEQPAGLGGAERKRVEAVVETLATLHNRGETLAEVAHDARNMVTALGLYCDLLEEPGVLATPFLHYGSELRLVAAASRRLVEKLVALDTREAPGAGSSHETLRSLGRLPGESTGGDRLERARPERSGSWDLMPATPIDNLAGELAANRNLLAALAGPSVALTLDIEGGALPVRLTGEDLTRVLVNLVKNAAEAMPAGGRIALGLHEFHAQAEAAPWLVLAVEDTGQGIPRKALDQIFAAGYTTRSNGSSANGGWAGAHRGLGLSITRSIVEAAGGRIHAASRAAPGARLEIELPVRTR